MFAVGDKIIYGKSGVCEVKNIGHPDMIGLDENREYYTLQPMGSTETIFTPVDTGVFMRNIISSDEAMALIRRIPEIERNTVMPENAAKELPRVYDGLFQTHECEDLVRLIVILRTRAAKAAESKRKITQTDQAYMRNAEDVLHGELAAALGMEKSEMPAFLKSNIE